MRVMSKLAHRSTCLCVVALLLNGCASTTPPEGGPTTADPRLSTNPGSRTPSDDTVVSVSIIPASLTLDVDGAAPQNATVQYAATGTTVAGATVPVLGNWSIDRPDLADIDIASGALVASGLRGGSSVVTFRYQGLTATATLKLRLLLAGAAIPS